MRERKRKKGCESVCSNFSEIPVHNSVANRQRANIDGSVCEWEKVNALK